jgi:transposase
VTEAAQRLFVTPRTLYRWVHRFQQHPHQAMDTRLGDKPRSGRPPLTGGGIETLLAPILDEDPRERGYRSTVWTAALLRQYLQDVHRLEVSQRSVSRALARLGVTWKRPRYDLARRSATWRQAKGGSNAAYEGANARSYSC